MKKLLLLCTLLNFYNSAKSSSWLPSLESVGAGVATIAAAYLWAQFKHRNPLNDDRLRKYLNNNHLISIKNDIESSHTDRLQGAIDALIALEENIETFKTAPKDRNETGKNIVSITLYTMKIIPILRKFIPGEYMPVFIYAGIAGLGWAAFKRNDEVFTHEITQAKIKSITNRKYFNPLSNKYVKIENLKHEDDSDIKNDIRKDAIKNIIGPKDDGQPPLLQYSLRPRRPFDHCLDFAKGAGTVLGLYGVAQAGKLAVRTITG